MAAPAVSYADLLNAAHAGGVGFSFRGFTITSKVQGETAPTTCTFWTVTVTKTTSTWTVWYLTMADGTMGRILGVVDDQGRRWMADWINGGWK